MILLAVPAARVLRLSRAVFIERYRGQEDGQVESPRYSDATKTMLVERKKSHLSNRIHIPNLAAGPRIVPADPTVDKTVKSASTVPRGAAQYPQHRRLRQTRSRRKSPFRAMRRSRARHRRCREAAHRQGQVHFFARTPTWIRAKASIWFVEGRFPRDSVRFEPPLTGQRQQSTTLLQ